LKEETWNLFASFETVPSSCENRCGRDWAYVGKCKVHQSRGTTGKLAVAICHVSSESLGSDGDSSAAAVNITLPCS